MLSRGLALWRRVRGGRREADKTYTHLTKHLGKWEVHHPLDHPARPWMHLPQFPCWMCLAVIEAQKITTSPPPSAPPLGSLDAARSSEATESMEDERRG